MRACTLPSVAALLLACAFGSEGAQAVTPGQYIGINLEGPNYYATEFPFLNLFKSASAAPLQPWRTSTSSNLDTQEEAYLQLDSDGYVTSLAASPTPPGGQQFTFVQTIVVLPPATPPGENPTAARWPPRSGCGRRDGSRRQPAHPGEVAIPESVRAIR